MAFARIRDFNQIINNTVGQLERDGEYINIDSAHAIENLNLIKYKKGDFLLRLAIRNTEKYQALRKALIDAGFEKSDFSHFISNRFLFSTFNAGWLFHFINTVSITAPELNEIKQEIANSLGVDSTQQYVVPTWLKEGNFNQFDNYGGQLNRQVKYKNRNKTHAIKNLELCGYKNASFQIKITIADKEKYQTLRQAIVNLGFNISDLTSTTSKSFLLYTPDTRKLHHFIDTVSRAAPELNDIKQEILDNIGFDSTEHYRKIINHDDSLKKLDPHFPAEWEELKGFTGIVAQLKSETDPNNLHTIKAFLDLNARRLNMPFAFILGLISKDITYLNKVLELYSSSEQKKAFLLDVTNYRTQNGNNLIHQAALTGNLNFVKELMPKEEFTRQLMATNNNGEDVLAILVNKHNAANLKQLIQDDLSDLHNLTDRLFALYREAEYNNPCLDILCDYLSKSIKIHGFTIGELFLDAGAFLTLCDPNNIINFSENIYSLLNPTFAQLFKKLNANKKPNGTYDYHKTLSTLLDNYTLFEKALHSNVFKRVITDNDNIILKQAIKNYNFFVAKTIVTDPIMSDRIHFDFIVSVCDTPDKLKFFISLYHPNLSNTVSNTIAEIIKTRRSALQYTREQGQYAESAMAEREARTAEVGYEKAKQLYEEEFQKRGLDAIEADIRKMLLKEILDSLKDMPKNQAQIDFIKKNEILLIQGNNQALMKEARGYFSSTTNENHLAWRAYDCYAPVIEWKNPLTPTCPLSNPINIVGVPQASEQDINDMRHRVALYFLALMTAKENETHLSLEMRKRIFIGQLGEIRQAPSHDKIVGMDNPSCPQGTKARIAKMGGGHNLLSIPDPIVEMRGIIQRLFSNYLSANFKDADRDTKERIALSLESFSSENIPGMLSGKYQTIVDANSYEHRVEDLASEYVKLINGFLAHHKSLNDIHALYDLINQELSQRDNPKVQPLDPREKAYIREQILYLSHNGIANKIAMNFRPAPIIEEKASMPIVDRDDPFELKKLEADLNAVKESAALSPDQKKLPVIRLNKQIKDTHEKTTLFNDFLKVFLEKEELKTIHQNIITYLTKVSVNVVFMYGDKKTLSTSALAEAYSAFQNTADFQAIPLFEPVLDTLSAQMNATLANIRNPNENLSNVGGPETKRPRRSSRLATLK